ncbi:MAG: hypothetical protein HC915_21660, partial [Anaerolineae bacterium]|nr:hypothetical protein [Anaerolineae bacterium]
APRNPCWPCRGQWPWLRSNRPRLRPPALVRNGAHLGAQQLRRVANAFGNLAARTLPDEGDEARRPRAWLANLMVLLAVLIPVAVIVAVVSLALGEVGSTAFEECRADVLERQAAVRVLNQQARQNLTSPQAAEARAQWQSLQQEAWACQAKKPGDEEMARVAGEAQNNLDYYDRVSRREVLALRQFPPNAELRGPVSGNWIQLYTLDRANDAVYRDEMNPLNGSLVAVGDAPIIFEGQSIRGLTVGDLIDIEWLERGGLPEGRTNVPIVMDEDGLLIWYSDSFARLDAYQLVTPATWSRAVALAMWNVNLYILDAGANQIWRYVPNRGLYSEVPEEYFSGENRPDLSLAMDMGISDRGEIYVLFATGAVRRYLGGAEQPFELYNVTEGALVSGSSLLVDNNPLTRDLVITDPSNQTVYTISLGGTVQFGYRPLEPLNAFEGASGALSYATNQFQLIYVVAGNKLYSFRR